MDLFCGAGGFSEGFRLAGCKIVRGIDHWGPATETFNHNFGLDGESIDMLEFENRPDLIEELPDTDVIIGSPPCVSFSYSNKLGNADKTEGLRLMKVFFSIIAVKKYKKNSKLVAWYMENVANAIDSLPSKYSFAALGLSAWARQNGFEPRSTAITIDGNSEILNAADFGIPQTRKRLFVGELIASKKKDQKLLDVKALTKSSKSVTLGEIRKKMPSPICKRSSRVIQDPLYPEVSLSLQKLTDHFYETGAYEIHWRDSRLLKVSHPYMGAMAFPENESKPSRTVVASPFPRSREALIYKSEWNRKGDGEYRGPTVREGAVLMSFPITYQFLGGEGTKWKLVGNAVCPLVAYSLARRLYKLLGRSLRRNLRTQILTTAKETENLNTFLPKIYDTPPKRKKLARFRSHPFKSASMTVALANYDVKKNGQADGKWRCFVTYGIGEGYSVQPVDTRKMDTIRRAVESSSPRGKDFVKRVTNGFSEKIPESAELQKLYEDNLNKRKGMLSPNALLEETKKLVFQFVDLDEKAPDGKLFQRTSVPMSQLFALFAVCQIAKTTRAK
jgi:DNA (cytosine-5)-methyltransferase 1